ncbi:hypothetical protein NJ7G_1854 [Natrinema sp. J7-2]|nr:hypothetical protein NJ7G_1854 [Natrinema sp. J7-2]
MQEIAAAYDDEIPFEQLKSLVGADYFHHNNPSSMTRPKDSQLEK